MGGARRSGSMGCRGAAQVMSRHCEERQRRSNPARLRSFLDCFAGLATRADFPLAKRPSQTYLHRNVVDGSEVGFYNLRNLWEI